MSRYPYRSRESKEDWAEAVDRYVKEYDGKISMVYRFIDRDLMGNKRVVYVGRSDVVDGRVNSHVRAINYFGHKDIGKVTSVNFCFIDGSRRDIVSFYEECLQYHLFGGRDGLRVNRNHPEQPHFRNRKFKCPICGGKSSKSYKHYEISSESHNRNW